MLSLKMKCETPDVSKYKEFETPQISTNFVLQKDLILNSFGVRNFLERNFRIIFQRILL